MGTFEKTTQAVDSIELCVALPMISQQNLKKNGSKTNYKEVEKAQ